MEAVILCGVQGSGKTTLYRDRFLETHVRVSMDLLRTRAREAALLRVCLDTGQRFVVDNTNPTPAERRRSLEPARSARFRVIGYLVEIEEAEALARNAERPGGRRGPPPGPAGAGRPPPPPAGVVGAARRPIRPTREEAFDELWHATAARDGGWRIEPLLTTPPLPG